MSRVCRKITGLFGLTFVAGSIIVAAGAPPVQQVSAASNDVNVSFKVVDGNFMAQIITPDEGSTSYSDGGITAKISYSKAQTLSVSLAFPDGHHELVDTIIPADIDGEFEVALPVEKYGDYTVTVSGTDLTGSSMHGDAKAFSYRAVTAAINEDGDKVKVAYGSNVCRLGFQVYKATDTAKEHPLLNPEQTIEAAQTGNVPNSTEVEIPGFGKLGPDEFAITVSAYDCLNDTAIDTDDVNMTGMIQPPKTGAFSILGMTISQTDYLVTGLVAFVLAAAFALYLLCRHKKARR